MNILVILSTHTKDKIKSAQKKKAKFSKNFDFLNWNLWNEFLNFKANPLIPASVTSADQKQKTGTYASFFRINKNE